MTPIWCAQQRLCSNDQCEYYPPRDQLAALRFGDPVKWVDHHLPKNGIVCAHHKPKQAGVADA